MTDGREEQKLKEEEDERMRDTIPPPALYKGSGLGLGRPAANLDTEGAGSQDRPAAPTSDGPVSRLHRLPPQAHGSHVVDVQN